MLCICFAVVFVCYCNVLLIVFLCCVFRDNLITYQNVMGLVKDASLELESSSITGPKQLR